METAGAVRMAAMFLLELKIFEGLLRNYRVALVTPLKKPVYFCIVLNLRLILSHVLFCIYCG